MVGLVQQVVQVAPVVHQVVGVHIMESQVQKPQVRHKGTQGGQVQEAQLIQVVAVAVRVLSVLLEQTLMVVMVHPQV
jgi:CO/xanthine dehydrogenase FAD-binding subunit